MPEKDSLIGKTINGKYVIRSQLGEGGMGRVYLAELESIRERKFAVKLLRPEFTNDPGFRQRFHDEARHQAQLDHPNIVQMVDYFHVGEDYYLVLDYVDGKTLSELIDETKGRGLPEKLALSIIVGVLDGLDCAHQHAILHRDVKSSNVLVDKSNRARITDFGIAMEASGLTRTTEGHVIGTPEYMSPEQLSNSSQIDHRSDIFSAGILLYEMLTGRLPFQGESFQAIQAQQMASAVPNPRKANPKISKRLAEIVRRSLQKNPVDRFQGGPQFIRAIESYRKRGAWKYVLVAACVLIAAAVYMVQSMYVNMQVIRDGVHTASHDYNILCREKILMENNTRAKHTADDSGQSDFSEVFTKKLKENRMNMQHGVSEYGGVFQKMTKFNQWTVRHVLDEADPDPQTALARKLVAADYDSYATHGTLPTTESMTPRCEALGYHLDQ